MLIDVPVLMFIKGFETPWILFIEEVADVRIKYYGVVLITCNAVYC